MKYQILSLRDKLLSESDYLMMPDYPLETEEKNQWVSYRQDLRDITEQEAWVNNDYINIKIPVSPRPKDQIFEVFETVGSTITAAQEIPPELLESLKNNLDTTGISGIIEKFSEIAIKVEILRGISRLKIPTGIENEGLDAINALIPKTIEEIVPESEIDNLSKALQNDLVNWQDYLDSVDKKIENINNTLSSYNLDFTISDILEKVSADITERANALDAAKRASELIEDLALENLEEGNIEL